MYTLWRRNLKQKSVLVSLTVWVFYDLDHFVRVRKNIQHGETFLMFRVPVVFLSVGQPGFDPLKAFPKVSKG
jgi:hypothetical protein